MEEQAFRQAVEDHRDVVFRIALTYLRDRADADEELLGAPIDDKKAPANGAINEDMASLDELLNQLVDTDDAEEAKDNDEE